MKNTVFMLGGLCKMKKYFDKLYRKHHVFQGIAVAIIVSIIIIKFGMK